MLLIRKILCGFVLLVLEEAICVRRESPGGVAVAMTEQDPLLPHAS
jgi:hypothetical protein